MHRFSWLPCFGHVANAIPCEHPMVVVRLGHICSRLVAHSPWHPAIGSYHCAFGRPRSINYVSARNHLSDPSTTGFHLHCAAKSLRVTPPLRRHLGRDGFLYSRP